MPSVTFARNMTLKQHIGWGLLLFCASVGLAAGAIDSVQPDKTKQNWSCYLTGIFTYFIFMELIVIGIDFALS